MGADNGAGFWLTDLVQSPKLLIFEKMLGQRRLVMNCLFFPNAATFGHPLLDLAIPCLLLSVTKLTCFNVRRPQE